MATAKAKANVEEVSADEYAAIAAEFEFQKVNDESPKTMEMEPGDYFVATFEGVRDVYTEKVQDNSTTRDGKSGFTQIHFRDSFRDGALFALPYSYKLAQAIEDNDIEPGSVVMVKYVKDVSMGTGRNPMKDYVLSVAKNTK